MNPDMLRLIDGIAALPEDWHGAGSVPPAVLRAIAAHAERIGPIEHSAETGAGKTTLLFSHLSRDHSVFAVDDGRSISQVKSSPLLAPDAVTFVEGPTQRTLPRHEFQHAFQMVLIDGPHGYPFPDLEYYYFYPHIAAGGLLLVDDTQIPTIGRMAEIIGRGPMFEQVDQVGNLAFYRRTAAPPIDPCSDSWWLQGYNKPYYDQLTGAGPGPGASRSLLRRIKRAILGGQP